jgi:endonuclease/exonuclease/phosphatase family metal-dependent hydrolase
MHHCFHLRTVATFMAAIVSLAAAPRAEARTLRVLSYNIHHSEGNDAIYNLGRIAAVINATNPDLVALQELDQGNARSGATVFQLDRLAELTGMQGFFGKTIDYRGGEYGNGILVRSDLHVTQVVNRPMPSPVGGEARGIMEVGISLDGANARPEFSFYASHFTAADDTASRLSQAAYINSLVENTTTPALLAGDFNANPGTSVWRRLREQWEDPTTLNPSYPRSAQIDFVFHRKADNWEVVEAGDFIVNPMTQMASDHYPFLLSVRLVPEPTAEVVARACGAIIVVCRRTVVWRKQLVGRGACRTASTISPRDRTAWPRRLSRGCRTR